MFVTCLFTCVYFDAYKCSIIHHTSMFKTSTTSSVETDKVVAIREEPYAFFEKTLNIADNGQRRVTFIDTGEHYILSFEDQFDPERTAAVVAKLYSDLGISLTFDPTDIYVTNGQQALIDETIGRVFSENADGDRRGADELRKDIRKIVDFYDVAQRAGKLKEREAPPVGPWLQSSKKNNVPPSPAPTVDCEGILKHTYAGVTGEDCIAFGLATCDFGSEGRHPKKKLHILYNTLFSTSLIFEDVVQQGLADDLCNEHPEFELVRSFPEPDKANRELCSSLFHKKATDKPELEKKVDNFVKLFDLDSREDERDMIGNKTEKEQVRHILKACFVVNDDPNVVMRAHDVLNAITRRLCNASGTFRKRLPGLLLECGLQKKRLRNGNHYYGIRFITPADFDDTATHQSCPQDIERQRKFDLIEQMKARENVLKSQ